MVGCEARGEKAMTDQDYDELSTKREMIRLLANDATAEQLDAAMHACIENRLNDAEHRTILIQTIYRSWYERLGKRPRPAGVDVTATWEDVERMFRDVLAMVVVPRPLTRTAVRASAAGRKI
jgi:hypothetical protein